MKEIDLSPTLTFPMSKACLYLETPLALAFQCCRLSNERCPGDALPAPNPFLALRNGSCSAWHGAGAGDAAAGSWQAVCCAASVLSPPGSEISRAGVGVQLVAEHGSPVSVLPAGRVPAKACSPLASMCQHPQGTSPIQLVRRLRGDSPCLRCPVPAGQTPPKPPLLPADGLGDGVPGVRGAIPAQHAQHKCHVGLSGTEGALALLGPCCPQRRGCSGTAHIVLLCHHQGAGVRRARDTRCRQGLGRQTSLLEESALGSRGRALLHGNPARA